jgi:hypothetical protein
MKLSTAPAKQEVAIVQRVSEFDRRTRVESSVVEVDPALLEESTRLGLGGRQLGRNQKVHGVDTAT